MLSKCFTELRAVYWSLGEDSQVLRHPGLGLIKDVVRQRHEDRFRGFLRPSVTLKLFHNNKNETFVSTQDCAFGIRFIYPGFSFNLCVHILVHTCIYIRVHVCL